MSTINHATATAAGAVAFSFPAWGEVLSQGHQFALAVVGLVVLVLTARAKWLEIQIKRETLRDLRKGGA